MLSLFKSYLTLYDPMDYSTPASSVLQHLPEFPQIYVLQVGDAIQPSYPLSPPSLALNPSIRIFSNESALHIRWPKYWSFSFSSSPSSEYSGLISFRIDWLDLLAVQGTRKSFLVQLSHSYMITRRTTALTRWTFVGKIMSLLFNTLHMDITRWSIQESDWLYSLQTKMEKLYTVSKNKTVAQIMNSLLPSIIRSHQFFPSLHLTSPKLVCVSPSFFFPLDI